MQREGVECTLEETKGWIDDFFDSYAGVKRYLDNCHHSVRDPGYVRMPFGRMRRFHYTDDKTIRAAQERAAANSPIQGTVADALSLALIHMVRERNKARLRFRVLLAIHDAMLLEVPYEEAPEAIRLLKLCMSEHAEIPGIGLKLGVDVEVFTRWGEKADKETLAKCGLL